MLQCTASSYDPQNQKKMKQGFGLEGQFSFQQVTTCSQVVAKQPLNKTFYTKYKSLRTHRQSLEVKAL